MSEVAPSTEGRNGARISIFYDTRPPELSAWRRMQIPVIGLLAHALVRLIGPTLRFEVVGGANYPKSCNPREPAIIAFWHRCIFAATWWWRNRGIVVLNSTNFDGQWTRRVIERFGFRTAQGSSSRGGLRGLVVMAQRLAEGHDVAFTIDGPRGPRYVAKPGPVMLARRTGHPILVFHIGLESAWTLRRTWDLFQVPKPFSRAVVVIPPLIEVPPHADRQTMDRKHAEMQAALERARDVAESWFSLRPEEQERLRGEFRSAPAPPAA